MHTNAADHKPKNFVEIFSFFIFLKFLIELGVLKIASFDDNVHNYLL